MDSKPTLWDDRIEHTDKYHFPDGRTITIDESERRDLIELYASVGTPHIGVRARQCIPTGAAIGVYTGRFHLLPPNEDNYETQPYVLPMGDGSAATCDARTAGNMLRYIGDAAHFEGAVPNVTFATAADHGNGVICREVYAICDIDQGTPLMADYAEARGTIEFNEGELVDFYDGVIYEPVVFVGYGWQKGSAMILFHQSGNGPYECVPITSLRRTYALIHLGEAADHAYRIRDVVEVRDPGAHGLYWRNAAVIGTFVSANGQTGYDVIYAADFGQSNHDFPAKVGDGFIRRKPKYLKDPVPYQIALYANAQQHSIQEEESHPPRKRAAAISPPSSPRHIPQRKIDTSSSSDGEGIIDDPVYAMIDYGNRSINVAAIDAAKTVLVKAKDTLVDASLFDELDQEYGEDITNHTKNDLLAELTALLQPELRIGYLVKWYYVGMRCYELLHRHLYPEKHVAKFARWVCLKTIGGGSGREQFIRESLVFYIISKHFPKFRRLSLKRDEYLQHRPAFYAFFAHSDDDNVIKKAFV